MSPSLHPDAALGEVYVMLTWRCNLRCRICPVWGEHGLCHQDMPDERLDVTSVVGFLGDHGPRRPRTVTLSGGEPLLSEHCLPLARALTEAGHRVALTTNATMLAGVPPLDLAWFHQINVSLDGPPLVLDQLGRGGRETLDAVLEGLAHVQASRQGTRPGLRLLTVITPEGVGHLVEMLQIFDDAGIRFDSFLFQHQMFLSAETARAQQGALDRIVPGRPAYWECLVDEGGRVDIDTLAAELATIAARHPAAVVSAGLDRPGLQAYYGSGDSTPAHLRGSCPALLRDLTIAPDGDLWLCPGHPVGNLFEDTLDSVRDGPKARQLREAVERDGVFPGCRACFGLYNYRGRT